MSVGEVDLTFLADPPNLVEISSIWGSIFSCTLHWLPEIPTSYIIILFLYRNMTLGGGVHELQYLYQYFAYISCNEHVETMALNSELWPLGPAFSGAVV